MGLSRATLAKYAREGLLKPRMILPSGHLRWSLPEIEKQLAELAERRSQRRERDE